MDKISLRALTKEHLDAARTIPAGRSSSTMTGGTAHSLRQTLIALTKGNTLSEHHSPGEASLIVLTGHVRLTTESDTVEGASGDLLLLPAEQHSLEALEDSAVILTVAKP
ncbi:cupin domain-containing protein [Streptomyces sp. SID3343]|uniref:cupin domain-containing protein n=1 Tax=Streptomyces sp. SID3343 TaxID=2690260 RepID=UPI00136CA4A9|nr:cupin domain-containing protein [Streptomyces sp. SID3343]MYW04743.1 LuxR family transcriptional regulator [Streptomyces sp. SID3343]